MKPLEHCCVLQSLPGEAGREKGLPPARTSSDAHLRSHSSLSTLWPNGNLVGNEMEWGRDGEEKRWASVMCPYSMVKGLFMLSVVLAVVPSGLHSSQSEARGRKLPPADLVTHVQIFLLRGKKKILN